MLGEEVVRRVAAIKKNMQEKIPAWVPRSVHALNTWLDQCIQVLAEHGLVLLPEGQPNTILDAPHIVTFATQRTHDDAPLPIPTSAHLVQEPAKRARAGVRRHTKVSFLQTAFCAVQGLATNSQSGRVSAKMAQTMAIDSLPGHKWSDQEIPGHVLAGWSSVPF